jgi:hypothetical protein
MSRDTYVKFDLSFNAYIAKIPKFGVFGMFKR